MERRAAALLLMMLSLAAVLLVAVAAADDDAITIRLPGVMAVTGKPWECYDKPVCTRGGKWCGCKDEVAKCADGCNNCREVKGSHPARYMCRDSTRDGRPDPCTKTPGNN